jgi:hypothetical protein
MIYPGTWHAIECHSSTSQGKQHSDPVEPFAGEAHVLHDFEQERPCHRVESSRDIDLEQQGGLSSGVQQLGQGFDVFEIVLDESTFYKCTLAWVI